MTDETGDAFKRKRSGWWHLRNRMPMRNETWLDRQIDRVWMLTGWYPVFEFNTRRRDRRRRP